MGRFTLMLVVLGLLGPPATAQTGEPAEQVPPYGSVLAGLYPLDPVSGTTLDEVAVWSGKRAAFGGLFHNTAENNAFSPDDRRRRHTIWQLDEVWGARATPFSNVEMAYRAGPIAAGHHDGEIRSWAAMVRRWLDGESVITPVPAEGRSLVIAPLQEMNGTWTPYGCYRDVAGRVVSEAGDYREAFRRFVALSRAELGEQAVRVRWAFAPNNVTSPGCGTIADYYPGRDVVDLVGLSAFNFGAAVAGGRWQSPGELLQDPLNEVRSTVAADLPFVIAQTGSASAGGDKDRWIRDLFGLAAADPNVVGLVWFNADKAETGGWVDWACCPDRSSGWREAMQAATTLYAWPLVQWFGPGAIPFVRVERPPVAAPDTARVVRARHVDLDVLANDADPDGLPIRPELVTQPAGGTATVLDDGRVRYTHGGGPVRSDVFTYRVTDGVLASEPVAATIIVVPAPATFGVFDPAAGRWHVQAGTGIVSFYFGEPGDLPLAGDWDCDGIATPGLYRPSDGSVHLRNTLAQGRADRRFYVGIPGDIPVAGDFDGDGCDTVSVFRPSEARVYIVEALGVEGGGPGPAARSFHFGEAGDRVFAGDFDGDGIDTVAVYRAGSVYLRNSPGGGPAEIVYHFGAPGDLPLAADWTADGTDTAGVARASEGRLYLRDARGAGPASLVFYFGEPGWLPVAGDFGPAG